MQLLLLLAQGINMWTALCLEVFPWETTGVYGKTRLGSEFSSLSKKNLLEKATNSSGFHISKFFYTAQFEVLIKLLWYDFVDQEQLL